MKAAGGGPIFGAVLGDESVHHVFKALMDW